MYGKTTERYKKCTLQPIKKSCYQCVSTQCSCHAFPWLGLNTICGPRGQGNPPNPRALPEKHAFLWNPKILATSTGHTHVPLYQQTIHPRVAVNLVVGMASSSLVESLAKPCRRRGQRGCSCSAELLRDPLAAFRQPPRTPHPIMNPGHSPPVPYHPESRYP